MSHFNWNAYKTAQISRHAGTRHSDFSPRCVYISQHHAWYQASVAVETKLLPFRILLNIEWQFLTDSSGQAVGPTTSITNCHSTLSKIRKERGSEAENMPVRSSNSCSTSSKLVATNSHIRQCNVTLKQTALALPLHVSVHIGHSHGNIINIWQGTAVLTVLVTARSRVLRCHQPLIENTAHSLCQYLNP